jgi:hypothetical protein
VTFRTPTARTGPAACPLWKTHECNGPARSCERQSTRRTFSLAAPAIAPDGGRWRRSAPSPSPSQTDGMAPWAQQSAKASSSIWPLQGSWTCGACVSTPGPFATCCANGCRQGCLTRMARSSIPRRGRLKAVRSRPSSRMSLCTLSWTAGLPKSCPHAVGEKHACAARRRTGAGPSACRRTRNGLFGCGPTDGRHSTSRGHQRKPIWTGAAVCIRARSGVAPCWDSRGAGPQIGTACPASGGARHARSSKALANGSRKGSSHTGTCRGGSAASVCLRDYEATPITRACAGTLARSTAFSDGPWTGRSSGSTGAEASGAVIPGRSFPGSSTASRERVRVLRKFHGGACGPEGLALHRGSEYNRGTGCGKTARPGLYGGCRVTGIPTVATPKSGRKKLQGNLDDRA